jgi:hypothetical protein
VAAPHKQLQIAGGEGDVVQISSKLFRSCSPDVLVSMDDSGLGRAAGDQTALWRNAVAAAVPDPCRRWRPCESPQLPSLPEKSWRAAQPWRNPRRPVSTSTGDCDSFDPRHRDGREASQREDLEVAVEIEFVELESRVAANRGRSVRRRSVEP